MSTDSYKQPTHPPAASEAKGSEKADVQLRSSALFFTADSAVPAGIRARDMSAMVQGMVDEHAPLPIEQTAWGFILDNHRKNQSHFLYYAAPRDLIFKNTASAEDSSGAVIIPGFIGLSGLHFKRSTWLFLLEEECLSAVHFEAKTTIPNRVVSRFLPREGDPDQAAFHLRKTLAEKLIVLESDDQIEGLLRIDTAARSKKGLHFKLSHRSGIDEEWRNWKQCTLAPATRILAADVRSHEVMEATFQRQQSGLRILQVAALVCLMVIALGVLEYLQIRQKSEAEALAARAEAQAPEVERLQEIESMTKTLETVFQKQFHPYRWLMTLNETRPDSVYLQSFALDESGNLSANGVSTEIKALNDFVETLQANPKFKSAAIASLTTDNDGVRFGLRLEVGDINAEPELQLPEDSIEIEAEEAVAEAAGTSETEASPETAAP